MLILRPDVNGLCHFYCIFENPRFSSAGTPFPEKTACAPLGSV